MILMKEIIIGVLTKLISEAENSIPLSNCIRSEHE